MTTRKNSGKTSPRSKKSTKKTTTPKKSEQTTELQPLEPINDGSKIMRFDAKAVEFLEGMKEKLGLESIHEVITTSFELLATLDTIEKSEGCHLAYKNEEGKIFPISLYNTEQNEAVLNTLKKQKEGNETSVEE